MNKYLTKYTAVPLIVQSIDAVLAQKDKNAIKAGYLKSGVFPRNLEAGSLSALKPSWLNVSKDKLKKISIVKLLQ